MLDPLSLSELKRLAQLMREAFTFRADQIAKDPIAKHIQNPKITPFLSESLALQLIEQGEVIPRLSNLRLGGREEPDIVATDRYGESIAIEVKGTGSSAWIYLSNKDYAADYLLWIYFNDFFENPSKETIEIYLVRPRNIHERRTRITLGKLTQLLGDNFSIFEINLEKLLDIS